MSCNNVGDAPCPLSCGLASAGTKTVSESVSLMRFYVFTCECGQAAGLPFIGVSAMTGVGCCVAFFTGLRTFRRLYSPVMPAVLPSNPANFHNDFTLSVAIGGMRPCFPWLNCSRCLVSHHLFYLCSFHS
jgi:hypothetical protein